MPQAVRAVRPVQAMLRWRDCPIRPRVGIDICQDHQFSACAERTDFGQFQRSEAPTEGKLLFVAHRLVMKQAIIPFAIGAVIGSAIGGKIVVSIPVALMQAILGMFMLYVCFSPKITAGMPTQKRFFALGAIGAFISMFIGATGTILAPWVRGVSDDRRIFVATHSCIMMFIHGLKVIVFVVLGFEFFAYLPLMATMVTAGFLGNWIGFKLLDVMEEELFRRVFQVVLILLSLRLLWGAADNAGYI